MAVALIRDRSRPWRPHDGRAAELALEKVRDLTKDMRLLEQLAAELARWAARWCSTPPTSPLKYDSGRGRHRPARSSSSVVVAATQLMRRSATRLFFSRRRPVRDLSEADAQYADGLVDGGPRPPSYVRHLRAVNPGAGRTAAQWKP